MCTCTYLSLLLHTHLPPCTHLLPPPIHTPPPSTYTHTSPLPLHTHSVNIVQISSKKNLAGDPSESEWNYCESELISVKVGFLSISAFPPAVSARELWFIPFVIVVMSITPAVSVKGNVLLLWVHSLMGNVYSTLTHTHTHTSVILELIEQGSAEGLQQLLEANMIPQGISS